jgi:peptidoglycan/xylan/chitin deacetylase (PgdA/CDA1 family)
MPYVALEYHDVVRPGEFAHSGFVGRAADSYKLTVASFEAHLSALEVIPTAQRTLVSGIDDDSFESRVLLTFDDAGETSLTTIAPMLESHGWRGYFFVPTNYLGSRGFVTPDGVRELVARGHVVGSHSASHPLRMGALSKERILDEWRTSRQVLEDVLGRAVTAASLPGGLYSPRVMEAAAEAGFSLLLTSTPTTRSHRCNGCRMMGRFTLRRTSTPKTALQFAMGGSARWRQQLAWEAKAVLKSVIGPVYLMARKQMWGN